MTSAVSNVVKSVVHRGLANDAGTTPRSANASAFSSTCGGHDKYRLRVTAGPSLDMDTQQVVFVNTDESCAFENGFMKVKVKVRIKDFQGRSHYSASRHGLRRAHCILGVPSTCPANDTAYFSHPLHTSDRYSIAFSFIPKRTLPARSAFWGNEFTHPVRDRLPPGFNTAFNIVKKFIDPGLECDAYVDKPWLLGPSLGCWFAFWVGEKADEPRLGGIVEEGGEGSGLDARRTAGMPKDAKERRRWALDEENRAGFVFEQGREYRTDFFNPYLDFSRACLTPRQGSLTLIRWQTSPCACPASQSV